MSDNVTLNAMAGGKVIAADDVSSVWYQRVKVAFGADGSASDVNTLTGLPVSVEHYDGAANVKARTPSVFKTATAASNGNNAIWTPASGKKFRLQRLLVQVTTDATHASGAVVTMALRDGSTTAIGVTFSVYVPASGATALNGSFNSGWIDLGNGILSATADNVLNLNLSAALATGTARVIVCGTEE